MQIRAVVRGFRLTIMALAVTTTACWAAMPPQSEDYPSIRGSQSNPKTKKKETTRVRQRADNQQDDLFESSQRNLKGLEKDFLLDQKEIWTSPARLQFADIEWLVPLAGITTGLFVTDRSFSAHLSKKPATISHYQTLSDAGVGTLIGAGTAMWLLGHAKHNSHWSETGFLAGEAAVSSLVVTENLKFSLGRARPFQGNGSGAFFQSGTSFPSEHAAAAWSVAGVIAHEYPGPVTRIAAYGLAALVDYSRVRTRQHFPSDVFIGSIIGNLVAQNIYTRHHDPELGGGEWRSIGQIFRGDGSSSPANQGSPYVPLDSWIYPALDRLSAMGLIDSGFAGMRPWTRNECARLLGEAGERVDEAGPEAEKTYRLLETEFSEELEGARGDRNFRARIESLYARVTGISGEPLTDGNHFGQTIVNDYDRPYRQGFNSVDGFSAWATNGHLVSYVRAEYQHAPSAPAVSPAARQFIALFDHLPGVRPATPYSAVDRVRLLDAYFGLNFENWQVTFGKQSLWWSPMQGGPLLFSDNAEPINMIRINRVSPFKLPSILGWFGPMRVELFMGQLAGHQFVLDDRAGLVGQLGRPLDRQPLLHGEKLTFEPTSNFEFSVSETTVFAGGPTPFTWDNLINGYNGLLGPSHNSQADISDPRSAVDFTYRIPGLRKWLTFYGDAFTEDEYSPLGYPRKSAFQGGIYLPRIPGVAKLDLRLEGGSTAPVDFRGCRGCFYDNTRYPDGSYVNGGNIIGSSLGRGGQSERAWSTYWFSPRNSIQFQYRHQKVDGQYLPHGGTLNDGGVKVDLQFRPGVTFSGSVQYEKWKYPLLSPEAKSNWTTSVGLIFWPHPWK